jgi:predicted transcriptional regulator
MKKRKIHLTEIESKILEILEWKGGPMSIRAIKLSLEEDYGIKKSPQVIKRLLLLLKRKGKID